MSHLNHAFEEIFFLVKRSTSDFFLIAEPTFIANVMQQTIMGQGWISYSTRRAYSPDMSSLFSFI